MSNKSPAESIETQGSNQNYFEQEHLVTFQDTNLVGNVYFSKYFDWQGKCREAVLLDNYPEIVNDLKLGFGMATEFARMQYHEEAILNDTILIRLSVDELTRSRIAFGFRFFRKSDMRLLAEGQQAIIWVNAQHRPSLMPEKLFNLVKNYFKFQ